MDTARIDLVLLDVNMPEMSGQTVCNEIRKKNQGGFLPVIFMSGDDEELQILSCIASGGNDYLVKPFQKEVLKAKVQSLLKTKQLYDIANQQIATLQVQNTNLKILEQHLTHRMDCLSRVVSPEVIDLALTSETKISPQEVVVVFVDLRGFTAFSENLDPRTLTKVLDEYYKAVGLECNHWHGTVGSFSGDGALCFFPEISSDSGAILAAIQFALALQKRMSALLTEWSQPGQPLGFGIGIAKGQSNVGLVGFGQRWDYTVIGTTPNLASRLCAQAGDKQILISSESLDNVGARVRTESLGSFKFKGVSTEVSVHNILSFA